MASPPKLPPRKAAPKIEPIPAKAPMAKAPVSAPTPKAARVPKAAKVPTPGATEPVPFVIEPEGLTAFVAKSDSALPPVSEPDAPVKQEPVAALPQEEPVAAAPEIKTETPTPPQPAVADDLAAATIEADAQPQPPTALEGHAIMNDAIETTKKFAEDAKARVQTLVTEFNEKAKAQVEKSSKAAEELSDIAKGNLEAIVESSKIAAKGVETLGQSAAEFGRSQFERTSATLKSFASVKSPTEFFQLHSELMTSAFDTLAAESAKTSEAVLKLAGEIAQPLSNRVAVVSDKLKVLAA